VLVAVMGIAEESGFQQFLIVYSLPSLLLIGYWSVVGRVLAISKYKKSGEHKPTANII
jgi:hypothetical protein